MTTWTDLRKLYIRLERLRMAMSREDPRTNGARGRPRQKVEEIAMQLERDIDQAINRMTSDRLIEGVRKKEQQRCGSARPSAA